MLSDRRSLIFNYNIFYITYIKFIEFLPKKFKMYKSLRIKKLGIGTRTHYVVRYINIKTIM